MGAPSEPALSEVEGAQPQVGERETGNSSTENGWPTLSEAKGGQTDAQRNVFSKTLRALCEPFVSFVFSDVRVPTNYLQLPIQSSLLIRVNPCHP
jgi:hypothetical protein